MAWFGCNGGYLCFDLGGSGWTPVEGRRAGVRVGGGLRC